MAFERKILFVGGPKHGRMSAWLDAFSDYVAIDIDSAGGVFSMDYWRIKHHFPRDGTDSIRNLLRANKLTRVAFYPVLLKDFGSLMLHLITALELARDKIPGKEAVP